MTLPGGNGGRSRARALGAMLLAGLGWSSEFAPVDRPPLSGVVLVANQQSANASLIDLATGTMRLIDVGAGPHEAAIAPSGRVGVVTVYGLQSPPGNQLAVIDLATGQVTKHVSLGQYTRPHGVVFVPGDETRVLVTSETTQNLLLVNLSDGRVETAIPTSATGSHMVGVTSDARRAWTANILSGSVSEIDLTSPALVRTIPVGPRSEGIAVAPDGSTVWVGSNTNGTVAVVTTTDGAVAATLPGFSVPYRLTISADGRTAIICDPQGDAIHVADVAGRKVVWSLNGLGSPRGVTISHDGTMAFVTLNADRSVAMIDLATRKVVGKVGVGASPDGVAYGRVAAP
jgi:YVTN family beta-propeller protein